MAKLKSSFNNKSQKKIQEIKELLHQVYESQTLDSHYINKLKSYLDYQYRLEEEFWRTKSRVQWLQAGDKNTRYFHEKTKQRRSFNRITAIADRKGRVWYRDKEIQKVIQNYFIDLIPLNATKKWNQSYLQ